MRLQIKTILALIKNQIQHGIKDDYMDIKTEANIKIFFDKYKDWMPFGFKFIVCLALFRAITVIVFDSLDFSLPVIYVTIQSYLLFFILVLFLLPVVLFFIFDQFFSKIDFKYNRFLLCCLILKEHHSSSKLNLEINKLKQAIENESQLYNDLNKLDFPYINKFVSRYYRYKKFNHTSIKNVVKDDLDKLNTPNPQLLTIDNVDNELNNLINNQFKNLNNEKQFNVINQTNKKDFNVNG